jgi:hypothetical protein
MGKTRATVTEKQHNILEKGRFLLADYCEIGVSELGFLAEYQRNIEEKGRITRRQILLQLLREQRIRARPRGPAHRKGQAPPPPPRRSCCSAVAAIACRVVPSFRRFKLRQGAKWTIESDDRLLR